MTSVINRPSAGYPKSAELSWVVPSLIVVVVALGAIIGLLAGLASPAVIGADGMAGTWVGAP